MNTVPASLVRITSHPLPAFGEDEHCPFDRGAGHVAEFMVRSGAHVLARGGSLPATVHIIGTMPSSEAPNPLAPAGSRFALVVGLDEAMRDDDAARVVLEGLIPTMLAKFNASVCATLMAAPHDAAAGAMAVQCTVQVRGGDPWYATLVVGDGVDDALDVRQGSRADLQGRVDTMMMMAEAMQTQPAQA